MKHKPDPELIDEDTPEWTAEDWARAQPMTDFPEILDAFKKGRGRPPLPEGTKKRLQSFKLSPDVITGILQSGPGYNGRVEMILREALSQGRI